MERCKAKKKQKITRLKMLGKRVISEIFVHSKQLSWQVWLERGVRHLTCNPTSTPRLCPLSAFLVGFWRLEEIKDDSPLEGGIWGLGGFSATRLFASRLGLLVFGVG